MSKSFHILSTGVSLITNLQRRKAVIAGVDVSTIKLSNDAKWRELLSDQAFLEAFYGLFAQAPEESLHQACAELNTFFRAVKGQNPSHVEVYLFGTKTAVNELVRRAIERILGERGYLLCAPYEISGYFGERSLGEEVAENAFTKGIKELIDRLVTLANRKKQGGYRVYFNPTGGLKAHVMATALAAYLTSSEVYYMNEEFGDIVFLPFADLRIQL
ncbi:MAG: putative CRISPR-associated protein [Dissulfuribacterales bacterium]